MRRGILIRKPGDPVRNCKALVVTAFSSTPQYHHQVAAIWLSNIQTAVPHSSPTQVISGYSSTWPKCSPRSWAVTPTHESRLNSIPQLLTTMLFAIDNAESDPSLQCSFPARFHSAMGKRATKRTICEAMQTRFSRKSPSHMNLV